MKADICTTHKVYFKKFKKCRNLNIIVNYYIEVSTFCDFALRTLGFLL